MRGLKRFLLVGLGSSIMLAAAAQAAEAPVTDDQHGSTITFEIVTRLFEQMQAMKWNADSELAWGYFFADHSSEKLFAAAERLEKQGYRLAGIVAPRPEEPDQDLLFLRVEKIERHTPQSLHARNAQLRQLAKEIGLEAYDGMNVGLVKQ